MLKATSDGDSTKISIHASDYGEYSLWIEMDGVAQALEIVCYQYNWWNTCDFNLRISVDHKNNTVLFSSVSRILNDEGEKVSEIHSLTLNLYDEVLRFAVVSA